jgi:tripartite-type tricarboxylate transporter receptor subunit TctC
MEETMKLRGTLLALALLCGIGAAHAEDWPSRPIYWIVPYPPGGGTDLVARVLGAELEKSLGQTVVVENRPGGSTVVGTAVLAKAAPDGYTFGMVFDSLAINSVLGVKTPYDAEKDFVPVIKLADVPLVFVVNSKLVPQKTLADLVAYTKTHPEWFTFGSLGPGSPHEIGFDWLKAETKMNALIVPYKGVAPALNDVVGGQVKGMYVGVAVANSHIKQGTLHTIAVSSPKRLESAPDIPTVAEQGYPDYDFVTFYGLAAPKGTPHDIVERMNKAINAALASPNVRKRLEPIGAILVGGSSKEFGDFLTHNFTKFRKIMAAATEKKK